MEEGRIDTIGKQRFSALDHLCELALNLNGLLSMSRALEVLVLLLSSTGFLL